MRGPAVALVVLLVALAGCSLLPPLPPEGIQLTIPARQDVRALPVTVVDRAGIVREATPAEIPARFTGATTVQAVDGRDDAVVLAWMGGTCDDRAVVTVEKAGDRYRVAVESRSSAMACNAAGVFRAVSLTLTQPVGSDAFDAP